LAIAATSIFLFASTNYDMRVGDRPTGLRRAIDARAAQRHLSSGKSPAGDMPMPWRNSDLRVSCDAPSFVHYRNVVVSATSRP